MWKHYWLKTTEGAIYIFFNFPSHHKELPHPNALPVTLLTTKRQELSSEKLIGYSTTKIPVANILGLSAAQ